MPPTLHPYTPVDADEAVAFMAAVETLDSGIQAPTPEDWREFTGRSFNHGASDFALLREDGAIRALLMSARLPRTPHDIRHFRIIVHPEHRRRGFGTRILEHVDAQDPEADTTQQTSCMGSWVAGEAFLTRHGFRVTRRERWMTASTTVEPQPLPDGLRVRPFEDTRADRERWKSINTEAYSGTPESVDMDDEDVATLLESPAFRLWFLEDGGAVVGLCHLSDYKERLYVNSLAVRATHRGRGHGRRLLLHAMAALAEEGVDTLYLTVREENTPAVRLYEALGFTDDDSSAMWCRRD